jgi:hypothetical protein
MMNGTDETNGHGGNRSLLLAPQNFAGGLALLLLALLALWLTHDLEPGTLGSMGSGMLPKILAYALGLCGLALIVLSFIKPGDHLETLQLRGPVLVISAIVAFALTIRSVPLGPVNSPELGMAVAAPLAILISGYATPEARLRELFLLAFGLTPVCMILFGDLLNLPIPLYPRAFAELFPVDWSQKAVLRVLAGGMLALCALVMVAGRAARRSVNHGGQK